MSRRKFQAAKFALLAVIVAPLACNSTGSGTTFPNYEVLSVPVGGKFYAPGQKWNTRTGIPIAEPNAGVKPRTVSGLGQVNVENRTDFGTRLNLPIAKWIGGSVGFDSNTTVKVEMKDLKHSRITDARPVVHTGAVVWETVQATSFTMTITRKTGAALDLKADLLKKELGDNAPEGSGPIEFNVHRTTAGTYKVTSSKPLVVAIRIVKLKRDVSGEATPLDLSTFARGRKQQAALGYTVVVSEPVDPLTQRARLRIRNPTFVGWEGVTHDFSETNDTWVNSNRQVITARDPRAEEADFVWDAMDIEWETDLAQCRLNLVRQYVKLERTKSGLKKTR